MFQPQLELNRQIWYGFGIKAKDLLEQLSKVELDNININEFLSLQEDAQTTLSNLEEELKLYLKQFPD